MPPVVALLNYTSCFILWRIFSQTGIFAGFSLHIINLAVRISAAAMAGDITFFSLAGPVGDYTGAHILWFFKGFSQLYSGKIYVWMYISSRSLRIFLHFFIWLNRRVRKKLDIRPWQPEFGPEEEISGFSLYIINFARRISEAAMGGAVAIYFLGCCVAHLEWGVAQ